MAKTKWRNYEIKPFSAAFMFMDEATRTGLNPAMSMTANTPALAAKMAKESGDELIFAHALVGPSDLLACVRCDTHKGLVSALGKMRKGFTRENFIHKTQCHLIVSIEGRSDLSKGALALSSAEKRPGRRPLRAWILATVADLDPEPTAQLRGILAENPDIKIVASVVGGYDYFIFVETKNIEGMQKVIDRDIRSRWHFTATDTRFVLDE